MKAKGKTWTLTYKTLGQQGKVVSVKPRVVSWPFLLVADALEHCRLNGIEKFRLEDKPISTH